MTKTLLEILEDAVMDCYSVGTEFNCSEANDANTAAQVAEIKAHIDAQKAIAANLEALRTLSPGDVLRLPTGEEWKYSEGIAENYWSRAYNEVGYDTILHSNGRALIEAAVRGGATIERGEGR